MKTKESRTPAVQAKKNSPFFNKEKGQGFFRPHQSLESGFFHPSGNSAAIQTKLTVGKPNDIYEKEADAMADRVVQRMNEPSSVQTKPMEPATPFSVSRLVQRKCADCEKEENVQKKPIFESEAEPTNDYVQRECAACGQEEKLQKKPIFESNQEPKDEKVQRKPFTSSSQTASHSVESSLNSSKGSGSPLPKKTRQQMESSIGADFSGVRIHDNSAARQMNRDLNAQAFAHGRDIYFNSGKYNPASKEGKHLLAHELTHVVQQNNGMSRKPDANVRRSDSGDSEAIMGNSTGQIQRQANSLQTLNGNHPGIEKNIQKEESPEEKLPSDRMLQEKPDFEIPADPSDRNNQGRISKSPLSVQRVQGDDLTDIPKVPGTPPREGKINWNGKKFVMTLTNFKIKNYENFSVTPPQNATKPKGKRETKQDQVWKKEVLIKVKNKLVEIVLAQGENVNGEFMLTVKGKKGEPQKRLKSQVIGDLNTLANSIIVPFWDRDPKPTIHQIEHIVDYQIMGNDADTLTDNLILLDKQTNREQGKKVKEDIETAVQAVMTAYKNAGIKSPIATFQTPKQVISNYTIKFEAFKKGDTVKAKSTIGKKDFEKKGDKNILSDKKIDLRSPKIPRGHCVIKTAVDGIGYIVPYSYEKQDVIKVVGDADNAFVKSAVLLKIIKKGGDKVKGAGKPITLKIVKDGKKDYFKIGKKSPTGYAGELQEQLKLIGLSPIEFPNEIEISPLTGIEAEGKVKPDISFLKDVDIDFGLADGNFYVTGTVSSDVLKGKLPKPFDVDYSDLSITVSSEEPFAIGGEIGFSIKDLGKGSLSGTAGTKGFGIGGKFTFDNAKSFKKAEIGFKYYRKTGDEQGKWEGNGELSFEKDVVPGVKKADIKIGYKDEILSGDGTAELSIPGIDKVHLTAQIDKSGNFIITGKADLKKIPGIKSSDVTATLTREDGNYSLAIAGTAVPNLPKIPGLGASFTVSYDKGVFKLEGTATYKQGKLDGSATVGVTNAAIDENGVPSKDAAGDKLRIYGSGTIKLDLVKGADVTLHAAIDEKGSMFVWGAIDINAKPFDPVDINKEIFKIDNSIPLVGVPFVNVNLRIGAGARFYFHWDPLTIEIHTTLDRTNIEDLDKAGGELTAKLHSNAKAGIELSITAGVGVTITVITVSANITGSVALEINAELGAEAAASWNVQKGLQLESADAYLKAVPSVVLKLAGDVRVELDLFISKTELYKKELGSVQKQIDLSQYAFGVKVPLEIDENGKIKGIDYDKLTVEPAFNKDAGDQITDKALNDDKKGDKNTQEEEAKSKIRKDISTKLRAKKSEGGNLTEYTSQLREETLKNAPPALAGFVDQSIQDEINAIQKEDGGNTKTADTPPPDDKRDDGSNSVQTKPNFQNGESPSSDSKSNSPVSDPSIESQLNISKGSGIPLPTNTRDKMESAFGADFSGVRIHDDSAARKMSRELNAQAFTHGKDIYFNSGKYDQNGKNDRHLLAHELTHVVQQSRDNMLQTKPATTTKPVKQPDMNVSLDMQTPKDDPAPDYTKDSKQMKAWEMADLFFDMKNSFVCGHIIRDGKEWSFVADIGLSMSNARFEYHIASEMMSGMKGTLNPGEVPGVDDPTARELKPLFYKLDARIKIHAKEHFLRYRQIVAEERNELESAFAQLPQKNAPIRLDQQDLESFMQSFILYHIAKFKHRLWKATCDWEKKDYPKLLDGIKNIWGIFKVNCDPEPEVPAQPVLAPAVTPETKTKSDPTHPIQKKSQPETVPDSGQDEYQSRTIPGHISSPQKTDSGFVQRLPLKVNDKSGLYGKVNLMISMEQTLISIYAATTTPHLESLKKEIDSLPNENINQYKSRLNSSAQVLSDIIRIAELIPKDSKSGGPVKEIEEFKKATQEALQALMTDQEADKFQAVVEARNNYINQYTAAFLDNFAQVTTAIPDTKKINPDNPFIDGFAQNGVIVWSSLRSEFGDLDNEIDTLHSQINALGEAAIKSIPDPDKRLSYVMNKGDRMIDLVRRAQALSMVYNAFYAGSMIFTMLVEDWAQQFPDIGMFSSFKNLVIEKLLASCKAGSIPGQGEVTQAQSRMEYMIEWAKARSIQLEETRSRIQWFANIISLFVGGIAFEAVAGLRILQGAGLAIRTLRFTLSSLAFTTASTATKGVLTGQWPTAAQFGKSAILDMATLGLIKGANALVGNMFYGGVSKIPPGVSAATTFGTLWIWSSTIQLVNTKGELDLSTVAGVVGKTGVQTAIDLAVLGFISKGLKTPAFSEEMFSKDAKNQALSENIRIEWNRLRKEALNNSADLKNWFEGKGKQPAKGNSLITELLTRYGKLENLIPRMQQAELMTESEAAMIKENLAREIKLGNNLKDLIRLGIEPAGERTYSYKSSNENLQFFLEKLKADGIIENYSVDKNQIFQSYTSGGHIDFFFPEGHEAPFINVPEVNLPADALATVAPELSHDVIDGAISNIRAQSSLSVIDIVRDIRDNNSPEMIYWLARKDVAIVMKNPDSVFNEAFLEEMTKNPLARSMVLMENAAVIDLWHKAGFEKIVNNRSDSEFIRFLGIIKSFNQGLSISSIHQPDSIIKDYLNTAQGVEFIPKPEVAGSSMSDPNHPIGEYNSPGDYLAKQGIKSGIFIEADFPKKTWIVQVDSNSVNTAWQFTRRSYPPDLTVDLKGDIALLTKLIEDAEKLQSSDIRLAAGMKAPYERISFLEGIRTDNPVLAKAQGIIAKARSYVTGDNIRSNRLLLSSGVPDMAQQLNLATLNGINPAELKLLQSLTPEAWGRLMAYADKNGNIYSIKGKVSEELITVGSEFSNIQKQVVAQAASLGIPAQSVRFVPDIKGEVVDRNGNKSIGELTDGAFIALKNNKIFFLAIFESKSPSNLGELVHRDDEEAEYLGQASWDFERLRQLPIIIGGIKFNPGEIQASSKFTLWFGFAPKDRTLSAKSLKSIRSGLPNFKLVQGEIRDSVLNELGGRIRVLAVSNKNKPN